MKTTGGRIHGRPVSEVVLTKWTICITSLQRICEEMEDFSGTAFTTFKQLVDTRNSRMFRDNDDMKKIIRMGLPIRTISRNKQPNFSHKWGCWR